MYCTVERVNNFISSLCGKDTSYSSKWNKPPDGNNSVYPVFLFDVQWSDCPIEVEKEVKELWREYELDNDHSYYRCQLDEELYSEYPKIYMWLKHKGIKEEQDVLIHWWW